MSFKFLLNALFTPIYCATLKFDKMFFPHQVFIHIRVIWFCQPRPCIVQKKLKKMSNNLRAHL